MTDSPIVKTSRDGEPFAPYLNATIESDTSATIPGPVHKSIPSIESATEISSLESLQRARRSIASPDERMFTFLTYLFGKEAATKLESAFGPVAFEIEHKSTVYTDGSQAYDLLAAQEYIHATVNHIEEYVRGEVHTQGIENFWSLLKRGLKGTYVAVEPFHLDRYVAEQVFRFNLRATKDNPLE
jgi:transposase-like protein